MFTLNFKNISIQLQNKCQKISNVLKYLKLKSAMTYRLPIYVNYSICTFQHIFKQLRGFFSIHVFTLRLVTMIVMTDLITKSGQWKTEAQQDWSKSLLFNLVRDHHTLFTAGLPSQSYQYLKNIHRHIHTYYPLTTRDDVRFFPFNLD